MSTRKKKNAGRANTRKTPRSPREVKPRVPINGLDFKIFIDECVLADKSLNDALAEATEKWPDSGISKGGLSGVYNDVKERFKQMRETGPRLESHIKLELARARFLRKLQEAIEEEQKSIENSADLKEPYTKEAIAAHDEAIAKHQELSELFGKVADMNSRTLATNISTALECSTAALLREEAGLLWPADIDPEGYRE